MNRESSTSYYYRVAQTIRTRIEAGIYAPGYILPPAHQIAAEFGVSSITIQKAMDLLAREGFVVRQRGVGTTVVEREDQRIIRQISAHTFWDWFFIGEKNREIALLEIGEIACPAFLRKTLNVQSDTVMKMRRVMSLGGEPIAYFVNYFPTALLKESSFEKFRQERFLKVLYREAKFETLLIDQKVQASTADMDLANALNIRFGDPVFFIEAVYRTHDETPVGLTHMYHRGDRILLRDLFTTKGSDIR